jgi:HSP20 family protein
MALVRWNPWTEMEALRRDFDRFFDIHVPDIFRNGGTHEALWMPRMDLHETDNVFVVEADLPGMSIEDIAVHVEGTTIVIAGERKSEQSSKTGNYARFERSFGKFQRAMTLPAAVQVDAVEAKYTNGVLTVTVPKAEEAKTKRIAITAA